MDIACELQKENRIMNAIENFITLEKAPTDLQSCTSSQISILLSDYLIDVSPHGNAKFIQGAESKSNIATFIIEHDYNGERILSMKRRQFGREMSIGICQKNTNGVFVGLYDYITRCCVI